MMRTPRFKGQAVRPPTAGPEYATCVVREKATGRVVTQATGCIHGKWAAAGSAKREALRRLKKKLGRRFDLAEYELSYQ